MINGIYILLGSNLGDKKLMLTSACKILSNRIGPIKNKSSVYNTQAWGKKDQPSFYNQVVLISSLLSPQELLVHINEIESEMGRQRVEKWGSRSIDIDILYYNDLIIDEPELTIPHSGIPTRRFTLIPLVEIAPDFIHPILKKTNTELLKVCTDTLGVTKL